MPFFVSLLVANVLQAIGTIINAKWVNDRNVVAGHLCTAQGGIKQAGNVGMALWCVRRSHEGIIAASHDTRHVLTTRSGLSRYRSTSLCCSLSVASL